MKKLLFAINILFIIGCRHKVEVVPEDIPEQKIAIPYTCDCDAVDTSLAIIDSSLLYEWTFEHFQNMNGSIDTLPDSLANYNLSIISLSFKEKGAEGVSVVNSYGSLYYINGECIEFQSTG